MVNIKHVPGPKQTEKIEKLRQEILPVLAPPLAELVNYLPDEISVLVEEIRLRAGSPLLLRAGKKEFALKPSGSITQELSHGMVVSAEMVRTTLDIMTRSSIYAWEEELRNGFLTLKGGHRVGLAGKVVLEDGRVKTIKYVSNLNIRISREIRGVGRKLLPYLTQDGSLVNTLIISPPQAGKTTLLRDLIRLVSAGVPELGLSGQTVGVVDERSELAGCWEGIPQNDLGPRTDVLDCCPKAKGMTMLLRAMAPRVIVTDELGKPEDVSALEEVVNGGVTVFTTVHGQDEAEIKRKPHLGALLETGVFERIVVLSRRLGVGTVEHVSNPNLPGNLIKGSMVLTGGK